MYYIYLIYLLFSTFFLLPVCANKSITYGKDSPDINARVYQGPTNVLPPEDEGPPSQPIVPAEPETPSTSSRIISAIWDLLPGPSTGLGSSSLLGAVSGPPAMGGFSKWLFGESSKECVSKSKNKSDEDDSSKRSKDK